MSNIPFYCNSGDTLELILRDRIVCGINDTQTQKCLLSEKNITYTKAEEIALALKSAVQLQGTIYRHSFRFLQVISAQDKQIEAMTSS